MIANQMTADFSRKIIDPGSTWNRQNSSVAALRSGYVVRVRAGARKCEGCRIDGACEVVGLKTGRPPITISKVSIYPKCTHRI